MSSHRLMRGLILLFVLFGVASVSVQAQVVPPVRQSVDANGVDLFLGTINVQTPGVSIGGEQGLSYRLIWIGNQWRDSLTGSLSISGSSYTVSFGPYSDQFMLSGSSYVGTEGGGATLVYNGTNTYNYTAADGTIVTFSTAVIAGTGYSALVSAVLKPSGDRLGYEYESTQYCTSAKETEGDPICLTYATAYRLAAITSNYGYRFELSHGVDLITPSEYPSNVDEWKRLAGGGMGNMAVASPNFRMMNVSRTYSGGLTYDTVTDPLSRQTIYRSYASALLGIKRPGSSSEDVTINYTGGRVTNIVTAAGIQTYATSDAGGVRTVTVTDPLSHSTIYTFDIASQRMTSVTDALGLTTSFQYDSKGRQTRITLPEGNYVQTTYQSLERDNVIETDVVAKPGSSVATITTLASFDATCSNPVKCNKPNNTTDAKGNVTDYLYDPTFGDLLAITMPPATAGGARAKMTNGYSSLFAYYNVSGIPGGSIVASSYPVRRLTSTFTCQTNSSCAGTLDEVRTNFNYGPQTSGVGNNLLLASASKGDGTGVVSATVTYGYDEAGNRIVVDGPLAGTADTVTYRYDAARQTLGKISPDPDGGGPLKRRAQRVTYNLRGVPFVTEIGTVNGTSDSDWTAFVSAQQVTTTFDSADRKVKEVVTASGNTYRVTQYSYDAGGRPECTALRMNSAMWGSLPSSACTLGASGGAGPDRITKTTYDNDNRTTVIQTAFGTSDEANEVSTTYSNNGKVATVTDGQGNKTTYEYDGLDRLVKTRYPDIVAGAGASSTIDYEQLVYDVSSNVISRRLRGYAGDAGKHIDFAYDNLNRIIFKDLPESGADVTYQYDLLGRPTMVYRPGITHTITYDALGRITSEGQPFGSMSYQYDLAGNRTAQVWNDGFYVNYDHLVTGEVTAVRENGAVSGVGILATYNYDDLGRRTAISRGNGTVTSYGFDSISRLSSLDQNLASTTYDLSLGFGYNPGGQILSTTRSNDSFAWTASVSGGNAYGINGLNQVSTVATAAGIGVVGYDAQGNLTSTGTNSYTYSSENLLVSSSGGTTLYYDVFGRLVEYDTSVSTRFLYDGSHIAAEIANPSGVVTKRYVYGPGSDEPLVWYEGSGTTDRRWLHADEHGSVIAVTNSSGAAVAINSYDEYGVPASGNIGRFQYTGQAYLPELGLYYYKARIYSARLGRFMQADPIGYGGGMSMYNYVGGDPVNLRDPSGLKAWGGCTGSILRLCPSYLWGNGSTGSGGSSGGKGDGKGGSGGASSGSTGTGTGGSQAPHPCPPCIDAATASVAQVRASILHYGGYWQGAKWVSVSPLQLSGGLTTYRTIEIGMLALGVGEAAMAARGIALLSEGGAAAAEDGEEVVTLYRGVDALHPGYSNALNGIANPISGTASASEHVFLGNTASGLTSWTSEYAVAEGFATRESGAGVILSNAFPRSALIPSPGNAVGLGESEFLIRGPVTGAGVILVP